MIGGAREGGGVKAALPHSPLALRHCSEGSGASWERSSSADSAVAGGECGTGGGAVQRPHLDPWGKSREVGSIYYYTLLKNLFQESITQHIFTKLWH